MESYCAWTREFSSIHASLYNLLKIMPGTPIALRKAVLTLSRIRPPRLSGSRYYDRLEDSLETVYACCYIDPLTMKTVNEVICLYPYIEGLLDSGEFDPIIGGILATSVIAAPYYDYGPVQKVFDETLLKEQIAALTEKYVNLNYSAWFGERANLLSMNIPLYEDLPVAPELQRVIQRNFAHARKSLDGKDVYPAIGKKTIGREAQKQCRFQVGECPDLSGCLQQAESIVDVERVYHITGYKLEGPTELRSAWRYNDLKPRIYYAQGPTQYHASKYVQSIFNVICDNFPNVHRKKRYEVPHFYDPFAEGIRLAIYDYSSFTSKLTEVRRFTSALAGYMTGVTMRFIDTFHGPIYVDLGEYLRDYNISCNEYPLVDIGPILESPVAIFLQHNTGMLGVPGNITSSTILHGLHLASVINDLEACKCVGDDAMLLIGMDKQDQEKWLWILDKISRLGDTSSEKTEWWDMVDIDEDDPEITSVLADSWHYLKRPVSFYSHIMTGHLAILPSLELILDLSDEYHRKSKSSGDRVGTAKNLCSQVRRFLQSLYAREIPVTPIGQLCAAVYIRSIYHRLKKMQFVYSKRHRKICDIKGGKTMPYFYWPLPDYYSLEGDFWAIGTKSFLDMVFPEQEEYTEISVLCEFQGREDFCTYEGGSFVSPSSPLLSLLTKLEYLDREDTYMKVRLRSYQDRSRLEAYLDGNYTVQYTYHVLQELPSWVKDI